jgi:quercetin dioxygenase-like cupin family protein
MRMIDLQELPLSPTSHDTNVFKKTMIANGVIPKLTTFSVGYLEAHQKTSEHVHQTMYEVFYMLQGSADFLVVGKGNILKAGQAIMIEPGESHHQENHADQQASWLYFGIATD